MTEDEMIGWHYRLNGNEFEQTLGDSEEQESLTCCSLWGSPRVRHDLVTEQQQTIDNTGLCVLKIYLNANIHAISYSASS